MCLGLSSVGDISTKYVYIISKVYICKKYCVDGSGKNIALKYEVNSNFIKKYKVHKIKKISENIFARKQFEKYFEKTEKNILEKIYYRVFNG